MIQLVGARCFLQAERKFEAPGLDLGRAQPAVVHEDVPPWSRLPELALDLELDVGADQTLNADSPTGHVEAVAIGAGHGRQRGAAVTL